MAGTRWLTIGQAAALLGVGETTAREYADSGRLKSTRLPSGHRRVDPESVEKLRAELYGTEPRTGADPAPGEDGDAGSAGG